MPFTCPVCGKKHNELPHIGWDAPHQWTDSLADDASNLLTKDLCIIEGRDYFVRGIIEIPVRDCKFEFGWGVWVSHKEENFETYRQNFNTPDIGPFFGWLCTKIDYFSTSTLELKTTAHYRGQGLRPQIVMAKCRHPLYRQQRDGISLAEAWKIAHHYMPDDF